MAETITDAEKKLASTTEKMDDSFKALDKAILTTEQLLNRLFDPKGKLAQGASGQASYSTAAGFLPYLCSMAAASSKAAVNSGARPLRSYSVSKVPPPSR